ncbi:MAG: hypothetical protein ACD_49C00067G0059 [uncultured bacterium (gcode 4)]|uniref:Uncharacterized protein n=1 Tax=uncultured bacterium (gcode 4) TaxID=1234023 RepID=K2BBE1_9BACT|nr:MAG: hypothetical protein ACD_49C00067G0059 [uncultured bacterium (gcode 4)]
MTQKEKLNRNLRKIAKDWIKGSFDLQKKVFEKDSKTKSLFSEIKKLASF